MTKGNRKLKTSELNRPSAERFRSAEKLPLTLVLDNVRSANNVGSVFRSADAFGIERILLCGITAKPPHRDIQKTALGATESVNWKYFEDTTRAIEFLRSENYQVWSIEQTTRSEDLRIFNPDSSTKLAIVVGNEVRGVQQSVIDLSDGSLEIQQHGTKHSLNVAVCTGILLYDLSAKLRK